MRGRQRQAVAQHRDLPEGQRAGHEVVQHQIQAQPVGHAAGGCETQAGDDHVAAIHLRQGLLGPDLRARVGGQRIERIRFLAQPALGEAVDAAARGEHEVSHPGVAGALGHLDAGPIVDLVGRRLEAVPHRVVRHGRQMDHRVNALQKVVRQLAHVAEVLPLKPHLGQSLLRGDAVREISRIIADELGVFERGSQMPRQRRSDIAHVSRDEYLHRSPQAPGIYPYGTTAPGASMLPDHHFRLWPVPRGGGLVTCAREMCSGSLFRFRLAPPECH